MLCDTNIISELVKLRPNQGVLEWSKTITSITVSAITVEEIIYGLTAKPNFRIQVWFENLLKNDCVVIPISSEISQYSGHLRGKLRQQGKPRTQADMLIAATAYVHGITLVTRNIKDFQGCEISLFNPFEEL